MTESRPLRSAHRIDRLWCDINGVYLTGWVHAFEHRVAEIVISSGQSRMSITQFRRRDDLLSHYPDHPHVVDGGFAAYLPCAPFVPVKLSVVTEAGVIEIPVEVPGTMSRRADGARANTGILDRFFAHAKQMRASVLELGGRPVSALFESNRVRLQPECRYTSCDVHAAPEVDVVADAHYLSDAVGKASFDAVFSIAVLEHLVAPWMAVAELNRALRLGGTTAHTTHQTWCLHEVPNDFWRFSDEALRFLFGSMFGFEIIEVAMASPVVLLPDVARRHDPFLEMPFLPGFGEASVWARKMRDIDGTPEALGQIARQAILGRGRGYPRRDTEF